ncbi:MAG TPA: metallophosphoesterase [Gammaproteobacteria bacterium]|nr:metallophosphoesterase [Gammaproteobacteria bacterium]
MKLAWLTDIHLNFLDEDARKLFYREILNTNSDGVLISGDIAEAPSLVYLLNEIADCIRKPIYFILGNHDYYKGNIKDVRDSMVELSSMNDNLFWLPVSGLQLLGNNTVLLGQDGWADGRFGDYENSRVALNDSRLIADLFQEKILGKSLLLTKMRKLADADAVRLKNDLRQAVSKSPKKIIVLTHVPPFKETCLHMGEMSGDDWLPYFSSKIVGDLLLETANKYPLVDFLVLCGHTHSEASYQALSNLTVKVGQAEYGQPRVQEIMDSDFIF